MEKRVFSTNGAKDNWIYRQKNTASFSHHTQNKLKMDSKTKKQYIKISLLEYIKINLYKYEFSKLLEDTRNTNNKRKTLDFTKMLVF